MTSPVSDSADRRRPLVVAIDGPAASGKSSTAKWVASELGFRHVDSGALYRAATAATLRRQPDSTKWTDGIVLAVVRSISLVPGETSFHAAIDGKVVEEELRSVAVTSRVSLVARMVSVRAWVNDTVRKAAEGGPVVVDGRDMGTAVFPQARVKIFLVADPWERAKRRLVQRLERQPTEEEVAEETDALVHRDAKDESQTQRASDAVLIDTTYLTQSEQVERIVALAKRALRQG
jgi:cytidylate kinase